MKIKKGDKVRVVTGKYKGTEGTVTKVVVKKERAIVEGVNVKKRAIKQKDSSTAENFIYLTHPIHVSNLRSVETEVKENSKPTKSKKTGEKGKSTKKSK